MTNDLKEFISTRMERFEYSAQVYEYGTVKSCADDIVQISGLSGSMYGELIELGSDTYGLALDLSEEGIGVVSLSKGHSVVPGNIARGTGVVAKICVGDELLGRVVDPIGRPLDGLPLAAKKLRPIEAAAPTIMQRSPVCKPLETGILAIDSMIPIGRGQRELIIGDRQTGKTSVALSAILNQKKGDVVCIYCAIGQKASTVSGVVSKLKESGAMENTVVVVSTADDCACMQYLSPYSGCAIGEEFMHAGKDVLIVYDDLSKHASSYRSMSLLLRRPSGREAYPGDVFYLHSRLLERSAKLSDENGGGSMTALPIVETMAGDISAYIPTNVISITDGQIFLETELFNEGIRPALNVGLSVSRVGRAAQPPAMRGVSGSLRLELAQYRDTAVFAQFGADIDESTAALLKRGERLTELLKQSREEGMSLFEQTVILLAYNAGFFNKLLLKDIGETKLHLLEQVKKRRPIIMQCVNSTGELSEQNERDLAEEIEFFFEENREK